MSETSKTYRVGIVLSHAGMNANQAAAVRQRLKFIAKNWLTAPGAEDGIVVTAPGFPHDGAQAGAKAVERLLAPLLDVNYLRVMVVENDGSAEECVRLFTDHDEVWCLPAERQSKRTKARPWMVYDLGMSAPDQYRKYKLIPPWVEPAVAEARDNKPKVKAMKGYL